jgi:hypothetical protein
MFNFREKNELIISLQKTLNTRNKVENREVSDNEYKLEINSLKSSNKELALEVDNYKHNTEKLNNHIQVILHK